MTLDCIEWASWLQNLLSGGAGALLVHLIQNSQIRKKEEADAKKIRAAIALELEVLWSRFSGQMQEWIQKRNPDPKVYDYSKMLLMLYSSEENYFVAFDALINPIALLENQTLSKSIFSTYVASKGMMDTLRLHNDHVIEYFKNFKPGDVDPGLALSSDSIFRQYVHLEKLIKDTINELRESSSPC